MTDYPASGCEFLDARLTFRRAQSTGLLEICNQRGQWSVVCGNNALIPENNIMVVCSQLGFDPNFVRSVSIPSTSVLNVNRPTSFSVISNSLCGGNESNLTACLRIIEVPSSNPGFNKRLAPISDFLTCSSLEVQCGGK